MQDGDTIYDELGIETAINAAGTRTRVSGPPMRQGAAQAMREAANSSVHISNLQAYASEYISEVTGSEAGYVTSGAAASLTLAAAACIAQDDFGTMARLPKTNGGPNEIIMPRVHRNGYDHALRAAGAEIVDVGNSDYTLGVAATNLKPWEVEDAITEDTAAIACLPKEYTQISVSTLADIADENNIPLIVDAAANLPPSKNLERYIQMGADLVTFSGGKAIRGPQSSGFLAGRKDLIRSAALQHLDMDVVEKMWDPPSELIDIPLSDVPRHGIGRGLKVGKEEIVGLIRAIELFVQEDDENLQQQWIERAELIQSGLNDYSPLTVSIEGGDLHPSKANNRSEILPIVMVESEQIDLYKIADELANSKPEIYVGTSDIDDNKFSINPFSITDDQANYIVDEIQEILNS